MRLALPGLLIVNAALAIPLSGAEPAATQPSSAATSQPAKEYADFEFVTMNVRGVTLHVQRPLAGQRDELAGVLLEYLQAEEKFFAEAEKLAGRADEIVPEIHRLVGLKADEKTVSEHRKLLRHVLLGLRVARPGRDVTIYMLGRQAIKDYLRLGGTLPYFTYDKAADKVEYFGYWGSRSARPDLDATLSLPVPLEEAEPVEQLRDYCQGIIYLFEKASTGMALHEMAELSILKRINPADPYFRWFSDGFANALTIHLLNTYRGPAAAKAFADEYEPQDDVARDEINLRYWPGLSFCIRSRLPMEDRISHARYCYATVEARRLIDAHGVEIVAKVLDESCSGRATKSDALSNAVDKVTGEDMAKRLRQYQTFDSLQEGIHKYTGWMQRAREAKDFEDYLRSLIRFHELLGEHPPEFAKVSAALSSAGVAKAADDAFAARVKMSVSVDNEEGRILWLTMFLAYALEAGRPEIAFDAAEETLKIQPESIFGLMVRLHRLQKQDLLDEAERTARHILDLTRNGPALPRREAARILREILQAQGRGPPADAP